MSLAPSGPLSGSVSTLGAALAATGLGPRLLFGVAGAAALAAFAWPVAVAPASGARPPAVVPSLGGAALARPLFDPGRRAWTARGSREAVLEGDPPRPILTLRGVRSGGGATVALIDDGSGEQTWLGPGEGRGGWTVAGVGPDRVTVVQDGITYTAEFMGPPAILRPSRRASPDAGMPLRP